MEVHNVERRLAAILATDVVGYSRLMEVDEAGTLARLKTMRLEVIDPAIVKCRGRIIKTTGDGMLIEFQSVTEALDLRRRFSGADGAAQSRHAGGAGAALSHRHQSRRCDRRRRRHFRRRRQCGGAARDHGRARGNLHLRGGARPGRRPAQGRLRRSRRPAGQEHHEANSGLQGVDRRAGFRGGARGLRPFTRAPRRAPKGPRSPFCRSTI